MEIFKRKNFFCIITLLMCFIPCLLSKPSTAASNDDIVCGSAIIRSVKEFNEIQKCTVIAGYVQIVEMTFTPNLLEEVAASNIEEISEYLLVYRVEGLDSLERLFPKLLIIRGVNLLYDQYALIVLENRDLQNIGLVSLLRVLAGFIRVESNPVLCFTHTINWVAILGDYSKEYNYFIKNNKSPNECPLCYTYEDEQSELEVNRHKKCWSLGKFQRTTLDYKKGCLWRGTTNNCLTSCSDNKCRHCTNFVSEKGCVGNCWPTKYKLAFKRQCVRDCTEWGLIQFGMKCVDKCPNHYQQVRKNNKTVCVLNCVGNIVINDLEDLEGLNDCTIIKGSLTIELKQKSKALITSLEYTFRHLNEITGYLKILNSPQIVSLHFFKNLHSIRGQELIDNTYSLYVVDNQYLENLWLQNVAILHGCVYFHLNPRLCYDKITDLKPNLRECTQISVKDASRNSNGERVVCGDDVQVLNATIADYNATAALVEVDVLFFDDLVLLIGYIYYYKEAPYKNVTRFDGRHGCGDDSWFTDVVVTHRRRHILKDLKPATQYAYFVQSLTSMDYPYQAEYVSKIQYFETEPAKPGPVAKIYTHSLSTQEIEIHWWPPRTTNGIIEKYILQYETTNETLPLHPTDDQKQEVCQCPKLDTESHMPTPHADDYHNKEQLLYKDALNNFLFQKKRKIENVNATLLKDGEARVALAFKLLEERTQKEQEEGKEAYVIDHPNPVCNQSHPLIEQLQGINCTALDIFERATEIPSQHHSFILTRLEPEKTYRISIRACVRDLANGCGVEKVVYAETVSKSLETLLENINFHK